MPGFHTIPFNIAKWRKTTKSWLRLERYALFELLLHHYEVGLEGLPRDDRRLAEICGMTAKEWRDVSKVVLKEFVEVGPDGEKRLISVTAVEAMSNMKDTSSGRSHAARTRWERHNAKKKPSNSGEQVNNDSIANGMQMHNQSTSKDDANAVLSSINDQSSLYEVPNGTSTRADDTNLFGDTRAIDPAKLVYDNGKQLLARYDIGGNKAGSLITRWRKAISNDRDLLTLLADAGSASRHDIVAFIEGTIRNHMDKGEKHGTADHNSGNGGRNGNPGKDKDPIWSAVHNVTEEERERLHGDRRPAPVLCA